MKHSANHIKRLAPLCLAILIMFQGIGWLLSWQCVQIQAKYAAHSSLFDAETPIQTLQISLADYQASKVGRHEISLDGNLYDIRHFEVLGDSIRLELYHDWHEQALFAILGLHVSKVNSLADSNAQPLSLWFAQSLGSAFMLPKTIVLSVTPTLPKNTNFNFIFPTNSQNPKPPFTPPRFSFDMPKGTVCQA